MSTSEITAIAEKNTTDEITALAKEIRFNRILILVGLGFIYTAFAFTFVQGFGGGGLIKHNSPMLQMLASICFLSGPGMLGIAGSLIAEALRTDERPKNEGDES